MNAPSLDNLLECVPNFSEGRDRSVMEAIVAEIASVPGITVCDWEMDSDHNRSVVTFAGLPIAVVEAAVRGAGKAAQLIDLTKHVGVHPRVGATDVIPFIAFHPAHKQTAIDSAVTAAEQIWTRFGIPTYLYSQSARIESRKLLEKVRRNNFDGLPPDFGTLASHSTAGASVVGARDFLIAYNIDLATTDVSIAQKIAREIRASSGGFPYVKAMGIYLATRNCAQVTMNLTNADEIPFDLLYQTVETAAQAAGTSIADSELIGFVPQRAYHRAPEFFRRTMHFNDSRILEQRVLSLL